MTYRWDGAKKNYLMEDNPDFVPRVRNICQPADTILVICRFGNRTAVAVNKLATAGFTKVYSIVDGFEGELSREAASICPDLQLATVGKIPVPPGPTT